MPEKGNEPQQARALKDLAKVFGDRSFYMGVTRASHEISIYTNNKALAAQAVSAKQDKSSAVEIVQRHDRERGSEDRALGPGVSASQSNRGFEQYRTGCAINPAVSGLVRKIDEFLGKKELFRPNSDCLAINAYGMRARWCKIVLFPTAFPVNPNDGRQLQADSDGA